MRIIDVDSHFMEPGDWLEQTDRRLADELASMPYQEYSAYIILGESVARIPAEQRPEQLADLLPLATHRHLDHFVSLQPDGTDEPSRSFYDGDARLRFCDERGIDVQFLNPSFGYGAFISSLRTGDPAVVSRTRRAWNTYAAEQVHGQADRLKPVTQTNFADVDWTIAEMVRMRDAGSVAFNLEVAEANGAFLTHPDFERIWSAAEDLGMVAYLHAGILFDVVDVSWAARNGRDLTTYAAVRSLGASYNVSIPLLLAALALDGVFERHPKLGLVVAEAGHSWLPGLLGKLEMIVDRVMTGTDPLAFVDVDPRTAELMVDTVAHPRRVGTSASLPLRPSEYLQRQVRVAPLSGLAALEPIRPTMDLLKAKEMLVFSSDYPHPEGRADAVELFAEELSIYDDDLRTSFFGSAMSDLVDL